jgi:hypothetical protein
MINLETPQFSIIIGADELKRQAPKNATAAALIISSYPLSDDEAATRFTMLTPADASVDEELHDRLSKMPLRVDELGLRMALVRWKDGTESLVGFPIEDMVPPPALLKSAYRNGYAAGRLQALVTARAEERRHG